MKRYFLSTVVITLLSSSTVLGWNSTGHMVAAYIAYRNLSPRTKVEIDKLLKHHPDYPRWIEGQSKEKDARSLTAFLIASTWPDIIKGDNRFYDENRSPTPLLDGFPDMKRHREWHFVDLSFSPDGSSIHPPHVPNAAAKIEEFVSSLANSKSPPNRRAYELVWLIHLIADIHQPLHSVSWITKDKPFGDRQGQDVMIVDKAGNLHKYWDDLVGITVDRKEIAALATALLSKPKPLGFNDLNVQHWMQENLQIAKDVIYTFDYESSRTSPIALSQSYKSRAESAARQRIILAGYRLAENFNQIFEHSRRNGGERKRSDAQARGDVK